MKIIEEFKEFAVKGNVVDLAVGVVVGGAFGKIVTSFVNDILMPPIGLLLGGVNFTELRLPLSLAAGIKPVTLNYGAFIQAVVDFLIISFSIFMAIKGLNALKKKKEKEKTPPPEPSQQEKLLAEIRDLLKKPKNL